MSLHNEFYKNFGRIICHAWCEYDNEMVMCLSDKNAICKIDKTTKDTELLGCYPNTEMGKEDLSASMLKIDDRVVFCPFSSDYIGIYNIKMNKMDYIEISKPLVKKGVNYSPDAKFYNLYAYDGYVYLFGWTYPAIIEIDIDTYKLRYIDNWIEEIEKHEGFNSSNSYFNEGSVLIDNTVYLPMGCINGLFAFNLRDRSGRILDIENGDTGYWGLVKYENFLWLSGINGNIFKFDLNKKVIEKIEIPEIEKYKAPIICEDRLLFYSENSKNIYFLNMDNRRWEAELDLNSLVDRGNHIVAISYSDGLLKFARSWYIYNLVTKCIEKTHYYLDDQEFVETCWKSRCNELNKTDSIFVEGKMGLDEFLSYIETL